MDPILLAALIMQESGGDQDAISSSGAVGLMQVMPSDGKASEFMCINGPCFSNRPTIQELLDPTFNIEYGTNFLSGLVSNHGVREGLFRYGPAGVGYEGYADKVIALSEMIRSEN
ncbi:transglycosylase SLT domain-containing protein [Patescibacteria group bacterium]|nr:transglycosylase SLT domain-containing protein [Patescibacteria group bacterium]